jgi:hypothetical protein
LRSGVQSKNTLLLLDFEAEIEKADGTRYVDNESIVTDKKNNCSWLRAK